MKSKLSNKYPTAELKYLTGDIEGVDPVFLGRLAAIAKDSNCILHITSGYRSKIIQTRLYKQYILGNLSSAAKPGTSWHEFRLAVDTSTKPVRSFGNDVLKKYGLCKPIPREGWHIQPLETLGQTDRNKFAPQEDGMTQEEAKAIVKEKAKLSDDTINYLVAYKFGESLIIKLAEAMKGV